MRTYSQSKAQINCHPGNEKNVCGGVVEKFYTFKTEMNGVLLMTGNTVSGEGGKGEERGHPLI